MQAAPMIMTEIALNIRFICECVYGDGQILVITICLDDVPVPVDDVLSNGKQQNVALVFRRTANKRRDHFKCFSKSLDVEPRLSFEDELENTLVKDCFIHLRFVQTGEVVVYSIRALCNLVEVNKRFRCVAQCVFNFGLDEDGVSETIDDQVG